MVKIRVPLPNHVPSGFNGGWTPSPGPTCLTHWEMGYQDTEKTPKTRDITTISLWLPLIVDLLGNAMGSSPVYLDDAVIFGIIQMFERSH
jgi:hypothetical protein